MSLSIAMMWKDTDECIEDTEALSVTNRLMNALYTIIGNTFAF